MVTPLTRGTMRRHVTHARRRHRLKRDWCERDVIVYRGCIPASRNIIDIIGFFNKSSRKGKASSTANSNSIPPSCLRMLLIPLTKPYSTFD
jgi:hypothetical protein